MSFESVNDADADDEDGRRTNAYPISSPRAFGSGELKKTKQKKTKQTNKKTSKYVVAIYDPYSAVMQIASCYCVVFVRGSVLINKFCLKIS